MTRVLQAIVLVCALLAGTRAAAEPMRLKTPGVLTTQGGTSVQVPAGSLVIPGPEAVALEAEFVRLQTVETRLTAENERFRTLTSSQEGRTLKLAGIGLLVGVAAGFVIGLAL